MVVNDVLRSGISEFYLSEVENEDSDDETASESHDLGAGTKGLGRRKRKKAGGGAAPTNIGKEETRMVFGSRVLVIVVLGIATVICGVGTYLYSTKFETDSFRAQV